MASDTASLLYKTSLFLNAISIPGHVLLGLQLVHPTLNTIQTSESENKKLAKRNLGGKSSAQACWNYVNGSLFVAGKPFL
jgi:hypothetical protein